MKTTTKEVRPSSSILPVHRQTLSEPGLPSSIKGADCFHEVATFTQLAWREKRSCTPVDAIAPVLATKREF
jgi:hypothetical protein